MIGMTETAEQKLSRYEYVIDAQMAGVWAKIPARARTRYPLAKMCVIFKTRFA
jgi:hypothetical protein